MPESILLVHMGERTYTTYDEAQEVASAEGLDLVLADDRQEFLVYRTVDQGKQRYDESKRKKNTRSAPRSKTLGLTDSTQDADLVRKVAQATKFLDRGMHVTFSITIHAYRKRTSEHFAEVAARLIEALPEAVIIDFPETVTFGTRTVNVPARMA